MDTCRLPAAYSARYDVGDELGAGGMGRVFRGRHLDLDRPVAIKFLTGTIVSSDAALARFEREARICSRLEHPNIVRIFDYDVNCEQPFIVFELLEGQSLGAMVEARATLELPVALTALAQVADALEYAHTAGVVHRDVKPDNVFLAPDGTATLTDFGIARLGEVRSFRTQTGVILGTPKYMSPEQARNEPLGPTTDVYALGVVLFEVLTGAVPFDRPSDIEIVLGHMKEPPPRLRDFAPWAPAELDDLVDRCLAKDPKARPTRVKDVAVVLRAVVEGLPPTERRRRLTLGNPTTGADEKAAALRSSVKTVQTANRGPLRRSVVVAEQQGALAPSSWRRRAGALFVVAALVLLYFGHEPSTPPSARASAIDIRAVSAHGVAANWTADWPDPPTTLSVVDDKTHERVRLRLLRSSARQVGPNAWHHEAAVVGLEPGRSYSVAIVKPDGTPTLPVTVRTPRQASNGLERRFVATSPTTLAFELSSQTPMAVATSGFGTTWQQPLALSALTGAADARLEVLSLDGERRSEDVQWRRAFEDHLVGLFDDFRAEHEAGDFLQRFVDEKGKPNRLFRDAYGDWLQAKKSPASLDRFWNEVLVGRMKGSRWYRDAVALAPAAPLLAQTLDLQGRSTLARGLAPLFLVIAAADYYQFPLTAGWSSDLAIDRFPLDSRAGSPFIAKPTLVRSFAEAAQPDLCSFWGYPLFDVLNPMIKICPCAQAAGDEIYRRRRTVDLTADELAAATEAEIHVELGTTFADRLIHVDVNDGAYAAMVRIPADEGRKFYRWAESSGLLMRFALLVVVEKNKDGYRTNPFEGPADVLKFVDKALPARAAAEQCTCDYFHRLPPQCLRPGRNAIEVRTIHAPTDQRAFTILGPVTLRLR